MLEPQITIPWVEKYRPTKFENIVLDPHNRTIMENIMKKNYFPKFTSVWSSWYREDNDNY